MATATIIKSTPIPPPRLVKGVTLNLTADEAYALQIFLYKIGGCPRDSLRKYTDSIGRALYKAKLPQIDFNEVDELVKSHLYANEALGKFNELILKAELGKD
jgi:hypothetical protein